MLADLATEIFAASNRVRAQSTLSSMEWDEVLARAASNHSHDMASHQFLSHSSVVVGRETLASRIQEVGGRFSGFGENLASLPGASTTASDFISGWMSSPGHRENLLRPAWNRSAVAVVRSRDGQLFATQLFGSALEVQVSGVALESVCVRRVEMRIHLTGPIGQTVGVFVDNRFQESKVCDHLGRAELTADLPQRAGTIHVSVAHDSPAGTGWIGVYDGYLSLDPPEPWRAAGSIHGGYGLGAIRLYDVTDSDLVASIEGSTECPAVVVVNGYEETRLDPGPFRTAIVRRARTGTYTVDLGVRGEGAKYGVTHQFSLDSDTASFSEILG
jgi:hypothetical protein